jgi:hypothetical protein
MAKEDPTQRLLTEIRTLNETNKSLKNVIEEYARTTANAMANTASAIQAINQTTASLGVWTSLFESIKAVVDDIKNLSAPTTSNSKTTTLTGPEKRRYADIAKIFDSVLKVRSISKLLSQKTKIVEPTEVKNKAQSPNETEEDEYTNMARIFNKVLKITAISSRLNDIKKILIRSELLQTNANRNRERNELFKPTDEGKDNKKDSNKKQNKDNTEKSWITEFIEKIPIIGDLFKIVRGISKMLFFASPLIAILSHTFTDKIQPWQGGVDLLAKIKLLGGRSFDDISKIIVEKTKTIIEWPFKFISEKFPNLFAKIKGFFGIKEAEKSVVIASEAAADLLKAGKGGFLGKLLGFGKNLGKGTLRALARAPFIGAVIGAYFAYDRYKKGDYLGVLIEIGSMIASGTGLGTPISIALGVLQAWRDWNRTEEENKQLEINKQDGIIKWMIYGIGDMLGSIIDWVVNGVKRVTDWVGSLFGFVKKDIESMKLPNTPQGVQEYYDKQIKELNMAAKSAQGRSSLNAKKVYLEKAEKLEQEKQKALRDYKLPANVSPIKPVEKTPAVTPPKASELKTETQKITVNLPNDEAHWKTQNALLLDQYEILKIIANKDAKFQNPNTVPMQMTNESVPIVRQKSNTKEYYFNSVNASTSLVGGSR